MITAADFIAAGLDPKKTAALAQRARRDAVEKLRREEISYSKIARRLGCAISTVEKDIKWLRSQERLP